MYIERDSFPKFCDSREPWLIQSPTWKSWYNPGSSHQILCPLLDIKSPSAHGQAPKPDNHKQTQPQPPRFPRKVHTFLRKSRVPRWPLYCSVALLCLSYNFSPGSSCIPQVPAGACPQPLKYLKPRNKRKKGTVSDLFMCHSCFAHPALLHPGTALESETE